MRVCKRKWMWFDEAKTLGGYVNWYWAPKGSKPLPFPTRFTSETWDTVHWWNPGAGEDDMSLSTYSKGALPGPFKGLSFCGRPEWFQDGCPSDAPPLPKNADGLPACCFGRGAYSSAFSDAWDTIRGSSRRQGG